MSAVTHTQGFPVPGASGSGTGGAFATSNNITLGTAAVTQLVPSPSMVGMVGVTVQARSTNTAGVFIGPSTMSLTGNGGIELRPSGSLFLPMNAISSLYGVAESGSQTVVVIWV